MCSSDLVSLSVAPLVTEVSVMVFGPRPELFDTIRLPTFTVVFPPYVFVPESVSEPEPCLTIAPAPEDPEMMPLKVVSVVVPDVSVALPSEIEPAPAIEPTVSEMLFKSHVAPLDTVTGVESDSVPLPDIYSVPAVTFVAPV